ncbi:hypothetical protein [Mycobacteroides saopaulense]|uniref:Uncharacterized protein n=1 Tax=Mycobacteroides saopaulense TaxID=1578165 RepID=A0ABX3BWF8_9MYCO|nr:hypothetical protein [Mycobacteroides saopaulense]OHT81190.1 hypothetical protein BKG68_23395 [Mycobacteroides saopaulense]OHU07339.1 hypothetical protein BKG73_19000 [Mycobacteroides saopaulense]
MTDPQQFDPTHYAADSLAKAGISIDVETAPTGQDPKALVEKVVQSIAQAAPVGWESLHGAFSFAGGQEIASVVVGTPDGAVRMPITSDVIDPIRTHRLISITERGPWFRLMFDCDSSGALQVAFDYGDNEIPVELRLPPEAYLRDFEEFPRPDAPLWLLAYMGNEGQQMRTAAQARAATTAVSEARQSDDEIPSFAKLWARFGVLSALCRGSDAPVGPRADPAFQLYLGDNGGSTLSRLPRNRGVLSGGGNHSPLLDAAYKGAITWPDLYRDSPPWVHNLYLDPRTANGLLSFCYWWDGHHWYRSSLPEAHPLTQGETPWKPTDEIARAIPGIWTAETTANLVKSILQRIDVEPSDKNHYAPIDLVRAAEARIVSENHLSRLFPDGVPDSFDIAEALAQLDATDVLLPYYPPIDQSTAKDLVIRFCQLNQIDTANYPLDRLVADRLDIGWQVFAPVADGQIAIGRMVFLVADDGIVDQASTSAPPSEIEYIFASRFAQRVRGTN